MLKIYFRGELQRYLCARLHPACVNEVYNEEDFDYLHTLKPAFDAPQEELKEIFSYSDENDDDGDFSPPVDHFNIDNIDLSKYNIHNEEAYFS